MFVGISNTQATFKIDMAHLCMLKAHNAELFVK